MSFIKLDESSQRQADSLYDLEKATISLIDAIELTGKDRWLSIGRTDIEKGFMALRKAIAERFKASQIEVD